MSHEWQLSHLWAPSATTYLWDKVIGLLVFDFSSVVGQFYHVTENIAPTMLCGKTVYEADCCVCWKMGRSSHKSNPPLLFPFFEEESEGC